MTTEKRGLLERLQAGEEVVCAEGYVFEFERRGYLKAGAFVPEVVLEHPDLLRVMYEEFVHAGSDVVEAFTYYGHRAKLKVIDREGDLEKLNKQALRIAREVADKTGTLMAGNICNTTIYDTRDEKSHEEVRAIFREQIEWAVQGGADFIIGETYGTFGEAKLALDCIKQHGNGLPAVITLWPPKLVDPDGPSVAEACKRLEEAGAAVVGVNCIAGPDSILPVIKEVRKACKGPVACLPVPYRTDEKCKYMLELKDTRTGQNAFPSDLNAWLCSRSHIEEFTRELKQIGVQYMGLCCGNQAHYTRAMAEALGRQPPASRYSPNMSQHLSQIQGDQYSFAREAYRDNFTKDEKLSD